MPTFCQKATPLGSPSLECFWASPPFPGPFPTKSPQTARPFFLPPLSVRREGPSDEALGRQDGTADSRTGPGGDPAHPTARTTNSNKPPLFNSPRVRLIIARPGAGAAPGTGHQPLTKQDLSVTSAKALKGTHIPEQYLFLH